MTHRTAATATNARRLALLTRRAQELLAEHSLPVALGTLLAEHVGASEGDPERLVGAREAGIPRRSRRRLIASGELPGVLVGREYLARRLDVDVYLRSCAVQPTERAPRAHTGASSDLQRVINRGLGIAS